MPIDTATIPALTRADLDRELCGVPGCDHTSHDGGLYLHATCHERAPLTCLYTGDGVLTFRCALCKNFVAKIAVASVVVLH